MCQQPFKSETKKMNYFLKSFCCMKCGYYICGGELAEWSIAAVLKTVELLQVPGVRIPSSPPDKMLSALGGRHFLFWCVRNVFRGAQK